MSGRAAVIFALVCQAALGAGAPLHTTFYPPTGSPSTIEAVIDTHGVPVAGARLFEDGREGNPAESVMQFRSTPYGAAAVLAIDASGSLKGGAFAWVKMALRDYVSSSRAVDRVAVVSFADAVDVKQAFTADKDQLVRAIDGLEAGGRLTRLNQAIGDGLTLLAAEKSNPRRRLIVITDGKNEGEGPDGTALENQARRLGIPVDCIGVTRVDERFLESMKQLAAASGGLFVRVRGYEGLRGAMGVGIEGLLGSPVLRFRLAHAALDGANHSLQVKIDGSATEPVQVWMDEAEGSARHWSLYAAAALAVILFGLGTGLIIYSRRRPGPSASSTGRPLLTVPAVPETDVPSFMTPVAPPPSPAPPPPTPTPVQGPPAVTPVLPPSQATEFRHIFAAPAAGRPAAWLRIAPEGPRFGIEVAEAWIGAGDGNRIRLAEDAAVSWHHACLQWDRGDLYLYDNRSKNGTRVNGRRMEGGSRVRLQPGDRILIGTGTFVVEV